MILYSIIQYANGLTIMPAPITLAPATRAFNSTLIEVPGIYAYNGVNYDCTADGLYIFCTVSPPSSDDGGYRIMWGGSDIRALMSAFAWLCVYGRSDEPLSAAALSAAANTRKLALRCGATCAWAQSWLTTVGIQSRIVSMLRSGAPTGFDDGHVLLEVYFGGQWILFDLASDVMWRSALGAPLNVAQVIAAGVATCAADDLAPHESSIQPWANTDLATDIYYDIMYRTPCEVSAWRAAIYSIPGIVANDGLTYFYMPAGTEGRQSWLLSLSASYRVITQAAWLAKFYP